MTAKIVLENLKHKPMRSLLSFLLIGVPAILLLASGTVWLVAGRALRPVEQIRRTTTEITAADFQPAFLIIAVIAGCACLVFARMPDDAGAELARRPPAPTDQKLG